MESKPWGEHCILAQGEGWKTKRLIIYPGGVLSLQRHKHREEHWLVTEGKPIVIVGDTTIELSIGESVVIKKEQIHRISNLSENDVVIIETQFGEYLEEDDIERFEDIYDR